MKISLQSVWKSTFTGARSCLPVGNHRYPQISWSWTTFSDTNSGSNTTRVASLLHKSFTPSMMLKRVWHMKHDNLYSFHQCTCHPNLKSSFAFNAFFAPGRGRQAMSDSALRADSSQWSPQAPRINQATSMRCSAGMALQISVYTWLPQDTCIQISLYRWMLRVWCDLTRVKLWRLWQDRDYYVSHILVILIAFKVHHTHGHILESSWNPEVPFVVPRIVNTFYMSGRSM